MNTRLLTSLTVLAAVLPSAAETVLIDEDFNGDYTKSFVWFLDDDMQEPHKSIASIFYSQSAERYMPWWVARDTNDSSDLYMASHSYYTDPSESNDWLISVPITIPTEGFVLSFDAQSVPVRGLDKLSDLALFVVEGDLDPYDLAAEPTMVWAAVPYGKDPDNCERDWTRYTYPLDAYAGKTVYVCFVNNNFDNDILCIDNIHISRQDKADFTLGDFDPYTTDSDSEVSAVLTSTDPAGLTGWHVSLSCAGEVIQQWHGVSLPYGEKMTFSAGIPLTMGEASAFTFTFEADNCDAISIDGSLTLMAFVPVHRVMYEESTSLHCGNCPIGIYNAEQLLADPVYGDRILPINVHIEALGNDPMSTASYYGYLPVINQAPLVWIDRAYHSESFIPAYDMAFDIDNPDSFAHKVTAKADTHTPLGIEVTADWIIEGTDTVAVNCTARVTPAINTRDKEYRVSFILTENNVGLDNNPYWVQTNYLSGANFSGDIGGWRDLPENVRNVRYHDVARATSAFFGHEGSLPLSMTSGTEYLFSAAIRIPNTYSTVNNGLYMVSAPIHREMCEITAIVTDATTGFVINAARIPMSEAATNRFDTADLIKVLGIADITVDADDESQAVYYDLRGIRVTPTHGVYIRVTPAGAAKIIK